MSDEKPKCPSDVESDLFREIREGRKFSLSEAIGRMAGPGIMKGVSPISGMQQAEAEIEGYLRHHLIDAPGVLSVVLLRGVRASEILLNHYGQPLAVLVGYVHQVLDSQYLLKELVREADMEWGRVYGERPFFDKEGRSPDPDDPYTAESVRITLSQLIKTLTGSVC